ncbi:hypothetical protein K488DRAFT_63075, partial [Vararia minispora EC-137]
VCHRLLGKLIDAFTPVLFTVGAARHMRCTDVLAERWMLDVIAPALADGGVGRPLETLERMRAVVLGRWAGAGVCEECVGWLREEYAGERRAVWERLDGWIVEAEAEESG